MDIKLNLPERVIAYKREQTKNGFKSTLWPNQVKDKSHEHSLSVSAISSLAKTLHELVMLHPSFKRPLKLAIEIVNHKSANIELDIANDENKKLNLQIHKYLDGKTIRSGFHFFRQDRKIDFGLSSERFMDVTKKQGGTMAKVIDKQTQHWVDKDGKNQTMIRTSESVVENNGDTLDIQAKTMAETLETFFNLDGNLHFDFRKHMANGVYNWAMDHLTKKKTEIDYKSQCLKIDTYDLPKESYKNNHLVNLCAIGKASDSDLVKFEYVQPQLDSKKQLKNIEKLLMKLSKAEEQQLRFLLNWDPEMIGEFIVDTGELIERKQKEQADQIAKFQLELEDKYNLLKDSFMNDLIVPMRKHRQQEFNEILKEINPKLAGKLFRLKRAAAVANNKNQSTQVNFLNFSENLAKKLFNFKVVKFTPEQGKIEFLFKPTPSAEGIKYGLKSSFEYLF